MPIGIAAPTPSGIPGFNEAYGIVARAGGGAPLATPLPSWYNVVTTVATAADSVALPPAYLAEEVVVVNATANALTVFGNINPNGVPDLIHPLAGGAAVNTGLSVPAQRTARFHAVLPQAGPTNSPTGGTWRSTLEAAA